MVITNGRLVSSDYGDRGDHGQQRQQMFRAPQHYMMVDSPPPQNNGSPTHFVSNYNM